MKGIYYYKLISPYEEDVTKNCKLTVTEIDSNFYNLKSSDIKSGSIDTENWKINLAKNDGEEIVIDISSLSSEITEIANKQISDFFASSGDTMSGTTGLFLNNPTEDFDCSYDIDNGVMAFTWVCDGVTYKREFTGIVTQNQINVTTDSTLLGNGQNLNPLKLSNVETTGHYRPVIKVIDVTAGESLPTDNVPYGARYLTKEKSSKYGYLYNYKAMQEIEQMLKDSNSAWRIPSKEDWDKLLNSIELCDEDRTHSSLDCHVELGKFAGKLLKSATGWEEYTDATEKTSSTLLTAKDNGIFTDKYGFNALPCGYAKDDEYNVGFGKSAGFWTTTQIEGSAAKLDHYQKMFSYKSSMVEQTAECDDCMFSIRLVKDYNGHNHQAYEDILGNNYGSVITINSEQVWTSENMMIDLGEDCTRPNSGDADIFHDTYFINHWTGEKWERKELVEGDIIAIQQQKDDTYNSTEYAVTVNEKGEYTLTNTASFAVAIALKNTIEIVSAETQNRKEEQQTIWSEIDRIENPLEITLFSPTNTSVAEYTGEAQSVVLNWAWKAGDNGQVVLDTLTLSQDGQIIPNISTTAIMQSVKVSKLGETTFKLLLTQNNMAASATCSKRFELPIYHGCSYTVPTGVGLFTKNAPKTTVSGTYTATAKLKEKFYFLIPTKMTFDTNGVSSSGFEVPFELVDIITIELASGEKASYNVYGNVYELAEGDISYTVK